MSGGKTRIFLAAFGATLALVTAWFVHDRIVFQVDARKVSFEKNTIKYHSLTGEWSVEVYNGTDRKVRGVFMEITVPLTEARRIFRLAPRGVLGEYDCQPFSRAEFRGKFGDFLPDSRIHGAWKISGVEFSRAWW